MNGINGLMKAENEDICCSYVAVLLNGDKRKSTCILILILIS